MPRPPRVHIEGGLYHAVLRGNHRQTVFHGDRDFQCFEHILAPALDRYGARLLAYCWMTNHVHLAVRVGSEPLGALMRMLASRYALAKQREIPTTGHLFERRYRSRLVDADSYLHALVRYIHLNPVRARMVKDPGDYPWSSHRAYLGGTAPAWLDVEMARKWLGYSGDTAVSAYTQMLHEPPGADERAAFYPRPPGRPARRPEQDLG